ncbi:ABC transporter permease [Gallaecimonas xiamenensis]|uniref:Peptide ABC transporter permease n=1 Tax=Gallaecimonas xiamenensis 3-C-1 TaxID=745411 RepID=K2KG20_9GAMM|nr:ABC transporter permease [Gallaecimonas xiamenensis]EKE76275.1 peptide ABC transporter permease [Gallaecimonas xiamenensis 3-C-1]
MLSYALRRLNLFLITFLLLAMVAFSLTHLGPGDPLSHLVNTDGLGPGQIEALRAHYHLDQGLAVQFYHYLGRIFSGDWGYSLSNGDPVLGALMRTLPATLELILAAMLLALVIGIPTGAFAAMYRNSATDYTVQGVALVGYSIPIFWWALLLMMLFSLKLGWLPVSGRLGLLYEIPAKTGFLLVDIWLSKVPYRFEAMRDALAHLVMPTLVLATVPTAVVTRLTRTSLRDVLKKNYIRAARARGWSMWRVVRKHGLHNALLPVGRILGLQLAALLSGAIITESIFDWPGVGNYLVNSIYSRDFPAIQGCLLILSTFVILVSVVIDILFTALDPLHRKRLHAEP